MCHYKSKSAYGSALFNIIQSPFIFNPVTEKLVCNLKNYPNPFRGATNIVFSTPVSGKATLKIYDLNGRMVRTLYTGAVSKGIYQCKFDTKGLDYSLGAGYYIPRLSIAGEKNYTRNIRLINLK